MALPYPTSANAHDLCCSIPDPLNTVLRHTADDIGPRKIQASIGACRHEGDFSWSDDVVPRNKDCIARRSHRHGQ